METTVDTIEETPTGSELLVEFYQKILLAQSMRPLGEDLRARIRRQLEEVRLRGDSYNPDLGTTGTHLNILAGVANSLIQRHRIEIHRLRRQGVPVEKLHPERSELIVLLALVAICQVLLQKDWQKHVSLILMMYVMDCVAAYGLQEVAGSWAWRRLLGEATAEAVRPTWKKLVKGKKVVALRLGLDVFSSKG